MKNIQESKKRNKSIENLTYSELTNDLHDILGKLEQPTLSIEDIAASLQKGFDIIDVLQNKLRTAETCIEEVIRLNQNSKEEDE